MKTCVETCVKPCVKTLREKCVKTAWAFGRKINKKRKIRTFVTPKMFLMLGVDFHPVAGPSCAVLTRPEMDLRGLEADCGLEGSGSECVRT